MIFHDTKFGRYARRKLLISYLHSMLAFVKASTISENLRKSRQYPTTKTVKCLQQVKEIFTCFSFPLARLYVSTKMIGRDTVSLKILIRELKWINRNYVWGTLKKIWVGKIFGEGHVVHRLL